MIYRKEFIGEALGTFILVLFGCGAVATSVLFNAFNGILQIAMVWGVGVTLAIYLTRHLSCAHLNPAVTIAMVISRRMKLRKLSVYITAQLAGALLAGVTVYLLFEPSIAGYEDLHGIVRGTPASVSTARMFGEYYQAPGYQAVVSMPLAIIAEAFRTIILFLMNFALAESCNVGRP
jgi:glycerol uptake facilitator protein